MSDDNRIKPKIPSCRSHPEAEVVRKKVYPGVDGAFCNECSARLGWYCMSEQNGNYCQYLRHTTATHMDLSGVTWVDCDLNKAEVEIALGEEEVQTDFD